MKVLVTGSSGFIGKNLMVRLVELDGYEAVAFNRNHSLADLKTFIDQCDSIVHLAGVNRPNDIQELAEGNEDLTAQICELIAVTGRKIPLILASSSQASLANPYGKSKRKAEEICEKFSSVSGNPISIIRLPGVFGKWCKPNYNSVVATFCHNIANHLPIQINDGADLVRLVYVDDVVSAFIRIIDNMSPGFTNYEVGPIYEITVGDLASQIESFKNCRSSLVSEQVGTGLIRALYATYVSYLPPSDFAYDLPRYEDERGIFVEMLKTKNSGQFSFFTAHPEVTRGGHYHHTKTEKFLVLKGEACFSFRNILSNERFELITSGDKARVVESVPGWTHDITNIGKDELVVMLWANEVFDPANPDTILSKV